MKTCAKCSVSKPLDLFSNHKKTKDGKCSWCKACHLIASNRFKDENPERIKEINKKARSTPEAKAKAKDREIRNKEKRSLQSRFKTIERKYGLSKEGYLGMVEKQNNQCKICGLNGGDNLWGYLYVDHCHETQTIRGLLCHNCNWLLGTAKDSIEILTNAIAYLGEFNGKEEATQTDGS